MRRLGAFLGRQSSRITDLFVNHFFTRCGAASEAGGWGSLWPSGEVAVESDLRYFSRRAAFEAAAAARAVTPEAKLRRSQLAEIYARKVQELRLQGA